jgi:hypothetical protein
LQSQTKGLAKILVSQPSGLDNLVNLRIQKTRKKNEDMAAAKIA